MFDNEQVIESALYLIDRIRPEIENGSFRSIYRMVQQLESLAKFAAIAEERELIGHPVIKFSDKDDDEPNG